MHTSTPTHTKTPNPQHTPGENNKSIQTRQNPGIRRFFQKTVKTGPHQVKHYPVCKNNIQLSLTKTITNDHVIQRYFAPHLHRVQSRGQPSQPQSQQLPPTCFKSYGRSSPHHPRNVPVTSRATHTRTYSHLQ